MDGGLGGGAGYRDGCCVEGWGGEDDLGVVGEAKAFLGDMEHVAIELVVGVFVVQGYQGVASGRYLKGDGGGGSGEGVASVLEGLVVVLGPAVGGVEDGEAGVALLIAEAVDVDDEGAGVGGGRLMGERWPWGDEGCSEKGCGEGGAAGEGDLHGILRRNDARQERGSCRYKSSDGMSCHHEH